MIVLYSINRKGQTLLQRKRFASLHTLSTLSTPTQPPYKLHIIHNFINLTFFPLHYLYHHWHCYSWAPLATNQGRLSPHTAMEYYPNFRKESWNSREINYLSKPDRKSVMAENWSCISGVIIIKISFIFIYWTHTEVLYETIRSWHILLWMLSLNLLWRPQISKPH